MARRPRKCVPVNFRCFRFFNGFRNVTDSGNYLRFPSVLTVSEICLRFPKYVFGFRNMFTGSDICMTYPGIVVSREYSTTPSGVALDPSDSEFDSCAGDHFKGTTLPRCHALVSRVVTLLRPCRGSPGAVTPAGGLPGRLPRQGVQESARCTLSFSIRV